MYIYIYVYIYFFFDILYIYIYMYIYMYILHRVTPRMQSYIISLYECVIITVSPSLSAV